MIYHQKVFSDCYPFFRQFEGKKLPYQIAAMSNFVDTSALPRDAILMFGLVHPMMPREDKFPFELTYTQIEHMCETMFSGVLFRPYQNQRSKMVGVLGTKRIK